MPLLDEHRFTAPLEARLNVGQWLHGRDPGAGRSVDRWVHVELHGGSRGGPLPSRQNSRGLCGDERLPDRVGRLQGWRLPGAITKQSWRFETDDALRELTSFDALASRTTDPVAREWRHDPFEARVLMNGPVTNEWLPDDEGALILLVDDDPIGLITLEAALVDPQYRFVRATNGAEAIKLSATFQPDAVLLDVMMPEMDGFEVCRRLRAMDGLADVPILLVTALDDRESRLRGLEAGADDYVTKPIDRAEVRARVRNIARLNRARRLRTEVERARQAMLELREFSERLALLREIDGAILRAETAADIARAALGRLRGLIAYDVACVALVRSERRTAQLLVTEGCDEAVEGTMVTLDETEVAELSRLRGEERPVLTRRLEPNQRRTLPPGGGLQSLLRAPLLAHGDLIGLLYLGSRSRDAFTPEHTEIAAEVADSLALALRQARLLEQVRSGQERQEQLAKKLIQAEEQVRRSIAHELHDEVGQALTAVKLKLRYLAGRPNRTASILEECLEIVDATTSQVRDLALNLRPSILDDLGLVPALNWYTKRLDGGAGPRIAFHADPPVIRADPAIETTCFRLAQEAMTNAIRHAQAKRIDVELSRSDEEVVLNVRDDGVGFDSEGTLAKAGTGTSLGLLGMTERVALVGGRLEIRSEPHCGTSVVARLPLSSVDSDDD